MDSCNEDGNSPFCFSPASYARIPSRQLQRPIWRQPPHDTHSWPRPSVPGSRLRGWHSCFVWDFCDMVEVVKESIGGTMGVRWGGDLRFSTGGWGSLWMPGLWRRSMGLMAGFVVREWQSEDLRDGEECDTRLRFRSVELLGLFKRAWRTIGAKRMIGFTYVGSRSSFSVSNSRISENRNSSTWSI